MSIPINYGGPAFPCETYGIRNGKETTIPTNGMTLRDYFMAHAPSIPWSFAQKSEIRKVQVPAPEVGKGCVKWETTKWVEDDLAHLVRWRATYADAMLAARKEASE